MAKIGILISQTQNRDISEEILFSIQSWNLKNYEVFFLDNGSNPHEKMFKEANRTKLPILYTYSSELLQFANAYNLLAKQAKRADCDYIIIIDPRFGYIPNNLEQLEEKLILPQTTLLGIKNSHKSSNLVSIATSWINLFFPILSPKLFPGVLALSLETLTSEKQIFDPRLFRNFELFDLIIRLKKNGHTVTFISEEVPQLPLKLLELDSFFLVRNLFFVARKNHSKITATVLGCGITVLFFPQLFFQIVNKAKYPGNAFKQSFEGLKDGWKLLF